MYQFMKQLKGLLTKPAAQDAAYVYGEAGGQPLKIEIPSVGGSVPAAVAAYVVARHVGVGLVRRTTLTLTAMPQAVVNGTEYQGTKIWTFPEGRILVLGVTATLQQTTTSTLASTLHASSTGALSLGSVTASNTTLADTMVDMLPSTAFTSSATVNVAGTAVSAALATAAQFDGTTTAAAMFLNSAFASTGDVTGNATMTWGGTINVLWGLIGDY